MIDPRTDFIPKYPSTEDLRKKASRKVPRFAFEYLSGGCNEDVNLHRNIADIQQVELMPRYIGNFPGVSLETELFGVTYDAPFGIAPIGLQGLIWPNSTAILAKAAKRHNIPFILSTVTTDNIEKIAEITESRAWFQLYHPADQAVTDDILSRLKGSGYKVLVLIADVPTFGFRPRDIRNGLSMPPKMSLRNFLQIAAKPHWAINTLRYGQPQFANLKPYMPKGLDMAGLGKFMDDTFDGRLSDEKIQRLRDQWDGKLIIKGVVNPEDAEKCIQMGVDGIIVSNHGGRQLDAGQSTIKPMVPLASEFGDRIKVMMDSGLRSGPDIARCIASGAGFTFMGRPFMFGVGALGNHGGNHTIAMLKMQLKQVMEQVGCSRLEDLHHHLINP